MTELLSQFPQVEGAVVAAGRPEDGTDAALPSNLEFFVKLAPMDRGHATRQTSAR